MTYNEAYREGIKILKNAGIEAPANDAGVLLCHVADCDRTFLYSHGNNMLDMGIGHKYVEMLNKRADGYPLQYLTGIQEFMSLTFEVAPGVLIPRQDTELLVETVLMYCRTKETTRTGKTLHILDLCTGSGCIAISLSYHFTGCIVTALDIMPQALEIAARNARRIGVADRVRLIHSNLLDNIPSTQENLFDVIVSNPPYIRTDDLAGLQREVRDFEPVEALDGGKDGLGLYRPIVASSHAYLKKSGLLALEIGYNQGIEVTGLMDRDGRYKNIRVHKDLAGNDRVVTGELG